MNEQRFARLQAATLKHIVPDGEEGFGNGGRLIQRQTFGNRQCVGMMRHAVFTVTTTRHQCHDPAADDAGIDSLASGNDLAGNFQSGNVRRARRRRITACPLQAVRPVDPGIVDLDQHLARSGSGHGIFFGHKHFRPARLEN